MLHYHFRVRLFCYLLLLGVTFGDCFEKEGIAADLPTDPLPAPELYEANLEPLEQYFQGTSSLIVNLPELRRVGIAKMAETLNLRPDQLKNVRLWYQERFHSLSDALPDLTQKVASLGLSADMIKEAELFDLSAFFITAQLPSSFPNRLPNRISYVAYTNGSSQVQFVSTNAQGIFSTRGISLTSGDKLKVAARLNPGLKRNQRVNIRNFLQNTFPESDISLYDKGFDPNQSSGNMICGTYSPREFLEIITFLNESPDFSTLELLEHGSAPGRRISKKATELKLTAGSPSTIELEKLRVLANRYLSNGFYFHRFTSLPPPFGIGAAFIAKIKKSVPSSEYAKLRRTLESAGAKVWELATVEPPPRPKWDLRRIRPEDRRTARKTCETVLALVEDSLFAERAFALTFDPGRLHLIEKISGLGIVAEQVRRGR